MAGSIRRRGNKWLVTIELGKNSSGKRIQKYFTANTQGEAEKLYINYQYKVNNGENITSQKYKFSKLLDEWLKNYVSRNCESTTKETYEGIIDKYIIPEMGHIELKNLKPLHIEDYYNYLLDDVSLSPNTVYLHAIIIRSSLDYAVNMQLINRNIANLVDTPKKVDFEASFYTKNHLQKLLELLQGHTLEVPIGLAAYLGLRRGEICGLRWKDIDFKNKMISIRKSRISVSTVVTKDPKTKSSKRTLYMSDGLAKLLKEYRTKKAVLSLDDYVWTKSDGTPYLPTTLSHRFKQYLQENKLPLIRLHDLRHTVATLLLNENVSIKYIADMLGHSNINTTAKIYAKVMDETKIDIAKKMNDIIKKAK